MRSPVYDAAARLLLPLMWVNLTAGENHWDILGLGVAQTLNWINIGLAWYLASQSPYQRFATAMLLCAFALRPMESLSGAEFVQVLRTGALGVVFIIAGACIYGRNPDFLRKQFVVFLALCVPIMFLQVLGVGSWVMGWSTGYLHDPAAMDESEVGTFMNIQLYPTLFVGLGDLVYSIGQARPVGLMHSSNVLSIFVAFAVALNLVILRSSRLRAGDLVVTAAVVLTMSKMVFVLLVLLYAGAILFAPAVRKVLALKLLCAFAVGMALYFLLFPGLLLANLSEEMIRTSIMLRLLGVLNAVGVANLGAFLSDQSELIGAAFSDDESYSMVAILLRSGVAIPALAAMGAAAIVYLYRMKQMGFGTASGYAVFLFACMATQFAIPFVAAASFQLVLGLALFPLFTLLWRDRVPSRDAAPHAALPATRPPSIH